MKLVRMTDYILEHPASHDYEYLLGKFLKYAQLLQKPLELEMLMPCKDDGTPMVPPERLKDIVNESMRGAIQYKNYVEIDYPEALEKVLFIGFDIKLSNERVSFFHNDRCVLTYSFVTNKFIGPTRTIEYLTNFGLEYVKQQI